MSPNQTPAPVIITTALMSQNVKPPKKGGGGETKRISDIWDEPPSHGYRRHWPTGEHRRQRDWPTITFTRVGSHLARSDTPSKTCIMARISRSDTPHPSDQWQGSMPQDCTRSFIMNSTNLKSMNPKNTNKSAIHENADITCNFRDSDISRLGVAYLTHAIHR